MSYLIPARPTTYRGIPMRSRMEATFAADLDTHDCVWAYEPRAYAGGGGQYLPDFEILEVLGKSVPHPAFIELRPTVATAYRAMRQMHVILESLPDATLQVIVPPLGNMSWVSVESDRTWRLL